MEAMGSHCENSGFYSECGGKTLSFELEKHDRLCVFTSFLRLLC